jgi:hypothetical protein
MITKDLDVFSTINSNEKINQINMITKDLDEFSTINSNGKLNGDI